MRLPRGIVRAAVRARDHLPEQTWPLALQLAALASADLPVIAPPDATRVLVVAPHPDDETIGCGGTLALLAEAGADVRVVVATDGEATIGSPHGPEATARRRRGEAIAACAALGVAHPDFLGLPDGGLAEVSDRLRAGVAAAHDALAPQLVLTPWPLDRHPDHRACSSAVGEVVADRGDVEVWGYEAHVPVTPTRAVDVSRVVERKRTALAAHVTAGYAMDLQTTLALNRWRSLAVNGGRGWAEVYLALSAARWREAVALAEEWSAFAPRAPRSTPSGCARRA